MSYMTKRFVGGAYVEVPDQPATPPCSILDKLADKMLLAAYDHFIEYNQTHPPACGVVWRQSQGGVMVVTTCDPKYADQLKRFVGRLK